MKEIITQNENGELFVKTHMTPGHRCVIITCMDLGEEDSIVLLDRREVEGMIHALSNSLEAWDSRNGLS